MARALQKIDQDPKSRVAAMSAAEKSRHLEKVLRKEMSKRKKSKRRGAGHSMLNTGMELLGGAGLGLIAGGLTRLDPINVKYKDAAGTEQTKQVNALNYKIMDVIPWEAPAAIVFAFGEYMLDGHAVGHGLGGAAGGCLTLLGLKLAAKKPLPTSDKISNLFIAGDDEGADPTMGDPSMGDPDLMP